MLLVLVRLAGVNGAWHLPCKEAEPWQWAERRRCTCAQCGYMSTIVKECKPPSQDCMKNPWNEECQKKQFTSYTSNVECDQKAADKEWSDSCAEVAPGGMYLYCSTKPNKKNSYLGNGEGDTNLCCEFDGNKIMMLIVLCGLDFLLFAWWFNK